MRIYSVHAREGLAGMAAAEEMIFIKEGFSWPALVFGSLWLIYQRMWLVLVFYVSITAAAAVLAVMVEAVPLIHVLSQMALAVVFAFEANNLRRWTLGLRGWRRTGFACGHTLMDSEADYFSRWQVESPPQPRSPSTDSRPGTLPAMEPLFPAPAGRG
jgi:hypothetical protein